MIVRHFTRKISEHICQVYILTYCTLFQVIRTEGIDRLSAEEVQNACTARGMRSIGVTLERMKSNLKQVRNFILSYIF